MVTVFELRRLVTLTAIIACVAGVAAQAPTPALTALPSHEQRVALFDQLVSDIERLDGDGLLVRNTRPESWRNTVARLRATAGAARTSVEYGHVFHRLRSTYPNSHAEVSTEPAYFARWMQSDVTLPVVIRAEAVNLDETRPTLRIASVNSTWAAAQPANAKLPKVGDIVVAINARPAMEWLRENEIFCRLPLATQCPIVFHRNLTRGLLFWHPETPLEIVLNRSGETIRTTLTQVARGAPLPSAPGCAAELDRVPPGFTLAWQGTMLCVFENPKIADTQIWRIATFLSEQARTRDGEVGQLKSVAQEIDVFYEQFWKTSAPNVKHLVIDLAGNGGGESAMPWLTLLLVKPFQSMQVRFKKIREFDSPALRKALFGSSNAFAQFLGALERDGTLAKIREGDGLPLTPMFCAADDSTCRSALHQPRPHGFAGQLSLVIDPYCNSACSTFAWQLNNKLSVKIYGLPDTGDTTFARLRIFFGYDSAGKPITSVEDDTPFKAPNTLLIGSFLVAGTVSTDAKGNTVSAKPVIPNHVVQRRWNQNGDEWARKALLEALQH
jgi:hypothetical protein